MEPSRPPTPSPAQETGQVGLRNFMAEFIECLLLPRAAHSALVTGIRKDQGRSGKEGEKQREHSSVLTSETGAAWPECFRTSVIMEM